ncbi:MAG: MFS transporter [Lysobacterales bacterium]
MSQASQFALLGTRRFLPFFTTQALGAFNDNVFKNALVIMLTFKIAGLSQGDINTLANLAAGLFILPFFLLSASAGQWAEKYERARSIRWIKLLEIAVMALAALGFWLQSLPFLLAVLFLMGAQSTLFGPIKYSILPEHLHPDELVGGNALVEAGTFLTILIGTLVGGVLMNAFDRGELWVSAAVILIAVLGYLSSRAIPPAPATAPDLKLNWNPFSATWHSLGFLKSNRAVLHSVLGISWFWFFGSVFITQLPNYTKEYLGGNGQVATVVLTLFSLGIGLGSLACERLSGRKVEIGLVPLGAIGLTCFGIDLYFARPELASVRDLSALAFMQAPGNLRVAFDLFMIGVVGGLYIVPLFALVQTRAERSQLSRIIAANNILNALFMVVAALLTILMFKLGCTIPQLLLLTAILNAVVAIYIFSLVPEFLMRFMSWVLINTLYRIEVRGLDKVPDSGPCLVVCNHASYLDALIVGGAVRRPIRFVMYHSIYKLPLLHFMFRTARTIPIAPAREDAAMLERAYQEISRALDQGEIVGIFPEGRLTSDGAINPFKPGVETILADRPVPVVPMALKGMWGSMFSRRESRWWRARLPRRFRSRIALEIADPVAPEQASAAALEAKVRALRGDWA